MKNKLLWMFVLALLTACTAVKQPDQMSLDLRYSFYTFSNKELKNPQLEEELHFVFPAIPGAIFGSPSDQILSVSSANDGTFTLSLPSDVDSKAAPFSDKRLIVEPATTKILRVGTFHFYPSYQGDVGGGSFISKSTGNTLILIYVSNAVNITGSFRSGRAIYHHDIAADRGWGWIEILETKPGTYELRSFEGEVSDITFAVLMEDKVEA